MSLGNIPNRENEKMWHMNDSGRYWNGWCAWSGGITPSELLELTMSTLSDILENHPELYYDYQKLINGHMR